MIDLLNSRIVKTGSPLCAGLDTRLEFVPPALQTGDALLRPLQYAAESVYAYNRAILDAIADFIPCVKVQAAYYEMYGPAGVDAMYNTIRYAKGLGLIVILDVKRNDIGPTATAYADAYIGRVEIAGELVSVFDADFITVNAYLGTDGISPFLDDCAAFDKGIFVLVKTSNPSSGELQDLPLDSGEKVYEHVMRRVELWGSTLVGDCGYSEVGAVVGATYPEQAEQLRAEYPGIFFLLPGAGSQGADLGRLAGLLDGAGSGAVINNSRAMLTAWKRTPGGEEDAARCAAGVMWTMREELHRALGS